MSAVPSKTLVIGLGNTLRGDDALGPLVGRRLRDLVDPQHVTILELAALTPELAADLSRFDLVLFVDASVDGEFGEIVCRQLTANGVGKRLPTPSTEPLTHALGPAEVLTLSRQLFGRVPMAFLLSSRGVSFDLQDGQLTPSVHAVIQPLIEQVLHLIESSALSASLH